MVRGDLHSALKSELAGTEQAGGVDFRLVLLQHGKDDISYGLHADPTAYSTAGVQRTDALAYLGFRRGRCSFVPRGECYAREAAAGFDLKAFTEAFASFFQTLDEAERHLNPCGFYVPQPEGWGYFHGKPSEAAGPRPSTFRGDGHTASTSKRFDDKDSSDSHFRYVLTWIEGGGSDRGWTTHYRPQHAPLSPEMHSALDFLGLRSFEQCPEFDFEPCSWRFIPYEQRGDSIFEGNAEFAHRSYEAHAEHFSPGIERLLAAHAAVEPFGLSFLRIPVPIADTTTAPTVRQGRSTAVRARATPTGAPARKPKRSAGEREYKYDVAISFAGPERHLAEPLATMVRDAGFEVFYDDFYPEQLWGRDLVVFFDNVYRKESRYCVVLVSQEYLDRMWTTHERRSAQARALKERGGEYILPVKVEDDVELEGMPPTVGYLSVSRYTIEQIGELLLKKLGGS